MRLASPTHVTRLRRVLDYLARASSVDRPSAAELVEPHVRCLVADHLGVGPEDLAPEVSLSDDLAADSLDLVELALVLEGEFGITVPEAVIEEVRTYGELVGTVEALVRQREADAEQVSTDVTPVRVRVVPPPGRSTGDLERTDWLTPYTAETIAEDALRSGPGARLEVSVPPDLSDAELAGFRDQLAWLDDRRIQVRVWRDRQLRRPRAA